LDNLEVKEKEKEKVIFLAFIIQLQKNQSVIENRLVSLQKSSAKNA